MTPPDPTIDAFRLTPREPWTTTASDEPEPRTHGDLRTAISHVRNRILARQGAAPTEITVQGPGRSWTGTRLDAPTELTGQRALADACERELLALEPTR